MQPSFRIESLNYRRCRRCNWRGPGYLTTCQQCAAAMGDLNIDQVVIVAPEFESPRPTEALFPAAVLAVELSAPQWLVNMAQINRGVRILWQSLVESASEPLPHAVTAGVSCVFYIGGSFYEAMEQAADAAGRIRTIFAEPPWEVRIGLAHGLLAGPSSWMASATRTAARLARAAQPGQTLTTLAIAKELNREWSFAPVGVLPRRQEDRIDQPMLLEGRKLPAPAPSALARDDGEEIVGREAELTQLAQELREATAAPAARWCMIVAPAGGGKSKLLRCWLKNLANESIRVVGASASPFGGQRLSVIADLSRQLGHPLRAGTLPADASRRLASAVRKAVAQTPVVLIIDDLHWADEASLKSLRLFSHEERIAGCLAILALRDSFLDSVSWLKDRSRRIALPELSLHQREMIATRLLPDREFGPLGKRLAYATPAGNPLFIEQCAAYFREGGNLNGLPSSLHDVILSRLKLLLRFLNHPGGQRPTAGELRIIEDRICEWLDRLETEDYEDRSAIAEYLGLLESMDSTLVVLKSIRGMPHLRNRRLLSAIDRFYSASYCERSQAIQQLAVKDRANAAYAAEAGAHQAMEALRMGDAIGYLQLAVRHSESQQRLRNLIELGDAYFWTGSHKTARRVYGAALAAAEGDRRLGALCELRLARIALAHGYWRKAKKLLEEAQPDLSGEESFAVGCELAYVLAAVKKADGAARELKKLQIEFAGQPGNQQERFLYRLQKTKLRIALMAGDLFKARRLSSACANTFVFESYSASEIADFLDTMGLLSKAGSPGISAELMKEVDRLAMLFSKPGCRRTNEEALDYIERRPPGQESPLSERRSYSAQLRLL